MVMFLCALAGVERGKCFDVGRHVTLEPLVIIIYYIIPRQIVFCRFMISRLIQEKCRENRFLEKMCTFGNCELLGLFGTSS